MRRGPLALVGVGALVAGVVFSAAPRSGGERTGARDPLALFQEICSACHGEQGRGDGSSAWLLDPKPRDFARGEFRLASTANGIPTDADLMRVLARGIPGTAMMPWADRVSLDDRRALVAVVKGFRRAELLRQYRAEGLTAREAEAQMRTDTTPGDRIGCESEPVRTPDLLERGRRVFDQACATCHGDRGRGNRSIALRDSRGHLTPPRELTRARLKGGSSPREIFTRLRAGMRGSAMPQFAQSELTDEEAWAVAYYVGGLRSSPPR